MGIILMFMALIPTLTKSSDSTGIVAVGGGGGEKQEKETQRRVCIKLFRDSKSGK